MTSLTIPVQDGEGISIPIEDNGSTINVTLLGGVDSFLGMSDTPSSYSGQSGKFIKVNGAEEELEFSEITVIWGNISGTLSNQTDLQAELDDKISVDGTSTTTSSVPFVEGISVTQDKKVALNADGTTYFRFNSSNNKIEVYVNNVIKGAWG